MNKPKPPEPWVMRDRETFIHDETGEWLMLWYFPIKDLRALIDWYEANDIENEE